MPPIQWRNGSCFNAPQRRLRGVLKRDRNTAATLTRTEILSPPCLPFYLAGRRQSARLLLILIVFSSLDRLNPVDSLQTAR
jgi:hypothetical protein